MERQMETACGISPPRSTAALGEWTEAMTCTAVVIALSTGNVSRMLSTANAMKMLHHKHCCVRLGVGHGE